MKTTRIQVIGATVAILASTAFIPTANASPPTGLTATTLATANLDRRVDVHGGGIEVETDRASELRVQQIVFAAGSSSGWHHHPGVVMVVVASGSVTLWDRHCKKTMYGPGLPNGAAFIESGKEPGQVTSALGATNYATYLVPKVNPEVFRIEDNPPSCSL